MNIIITLNEGLGDALGPTFNITSDVGTVVPDTATLVELLSGKTVNVDDNTTLITIESLGNCINSLDLPVTTTTTTIIQSYYTFNIKYGSSPAAACDGIDYVVYAPVPSPTLGDVIYEDIDFLIGFDNGEYVKFNYDNYPYQIDIGQAGFLLAKSTTNCSTSTGTTYYYNTYKYVCGTCVYYGSGVSSVSSPVQLVLGGYYTLTDGYVHKIRNAHTSGAEDFTGAAGPYYSCASITC